MRTVFHQTLKLLQTFRVSYLSVLALAALLLLALGGVAVYAQSGGGYDLFWSTVDGGGAAAAGGGYTLHSTAGQPEPGPALTGGGFTLTGGFWPAGLESSGGGGDVYLPLIMKER